MALTWPDVGRCVGKHEESGLGPAGAVAPFRRTRHREPDRKLAGYIPRPDQPIHHCLGSLNPARPPVTAYRQPAIGNRPATGNWPGNPVLRFLLGRLSSSPPATLPGRTFTLCVADSLPSKSQPRLAVTAGSCWPGPAGSFAKNPSMFSGAGRRRPVLRSWSGIIGTVGSGYCGVAASRNAVWEETRWPPGQSYRPRT